MRFISAFFLIFSIVLILSDCQNTIERDDIPRIYVHKEINLNSYEYKNLNNFGGYVYIAGGVRGIIIYRKSTSQYLAFERDCPYQPQDSCALVSVDPSTLYMIDTCCGSQFDFDGNPIAGPAKFPLLQYNTYLNQNYLIITSD